jgi:multidrug resistance efflux pump
MKKVMFLFFTVFLFAYEAKVEPFEIYKIKSSVSGTVVESNKNLEARNVQNALLVKIDDIQNRIDLQNLQNQKKILTEEIKNQVQIVKRKKDVYEKYKKLKTKSQTEKDIKFYDYMNAYNQLLNLRLQLKSVNSNIAKLKDTVNKKNIKADGYVFKIYVNRGDYVVPGALIADIYDISKEKIVIYVPIDEAENIKNKTVYINGKKSSFKIYKVWSVPDAQYVTSYKVEITGNGLKLGSIVKVELK